MTGEEEMTAGCAGRRQGGDSALPTLLLCKGPPPSPALSQTVGRGRAVTHGLSWAPPGPALSSEDSRGRGRLLGRARA